MKFKISYHPVWEQTLTTPEKEKYEYALAHYSSDKQSTSICPVLINKKKNGGLVATIFICNGSNAKLEIQKTTVEVLNEEENRIANAMFTPRLTIPPYTAMPWSFVFSPLQLTNTQTPLDNCSVLISPIY